MGALDPISEKADLAEARLQLLWLSLAGGFGFAVSVSEAWDPAIRLGLSNVLTWFSAVLICIVLRHLLGQRDQSPKLLTIPFGACCFCAVSNVQLGNYIAFSVTLFFTFGIGLLIMRPGKAAGRGLLAELYGVLVIMVVGGVGALPYTLWLNGSPGCASAARSFHAALDCATHIFPLTQTTFFGLLLGIGRGYRILDGRSGLGRLRLRRGIIFAIALASGMVLAYMYPRGWLKAVTAGGYGAGELAGAVMVVLASSYVACVGIAPLVLLYSLKRWTRLGRAQWFVYPLLVGLGGAVQAAITTKIRGSVLDGVWHNYFGLPIPQLSERVVETFPSGGLIWHTYFGLPVPQLSEHVFETFPFGGFMWSWAHLLVDVPTAIFIACSLLIAGPILRKDASVLFEGAGQND